MTSLYQTLLEALETENFTAIRKCFAELTADQQVQQDADLIKTIAKKMCSGEHADFKKEFEIFYTCRFLLCQRFEEDLDLDLICYWGQKIKLDTNGDYFLMNE